MKLPSGFDLHSLEVFLLTAELGGMTQTANLLGQTQSAVSQTIGKLETALGATLFDRSLRPLALTHAGKVLFEQGSTLVVSAKGLVGEIRGSKHLPIQTVTVAMAESMANQLTAPLLTELGKRAVCWRIRSGLSITQHQEFLLRKFDMLVTASSELKDAPTVQHIPILQEPFIIILPRDYAGEIDLKSMADRMPFIRYTLQSAMGQQIEQQMSRMRLPLRDFVEVDTSHQQLDAVAAGLGWSVSTPLCIASHVSMLDQLRLEPMPRAQFGRLFQLVAREEDLSDLPMETAALARRVLRDVTFPNLIARHAWIEQALEWPE